MRHVVNFGLLAAFAVVAITGAMAFLLPFSIDTTRVHVIGGIAACLLVLAHVLQRTKYFRSQWGGPRGRAVSKPTLSLIFLLSLGVVFAAAKGIPPVTWVVQQGYEARHRAEIVRTSSLVDFDQPSPHSKLIVRQRQSETACGLSILLRFNKDLQSIPAVAVWAETPTGTIIETLHVQPSLAFSDQPTWDGNPTQRNRILPIWRNRYTVIAGIDASGRVDAMTGATQSHQFALEEYLNPGEGHEFVICAEVNAPADPNDHFPDPDVGQPSLLYTAFVEVDRELPYSLLELTGHGGEAETSGNTSYDLDGFTSAKRLADLFLVKLEKPRQTL